MRRIIPVPLSLQEANNFVTLNHRHHDPVHRDKYRVGASIDGKLVGVVQVGRPVSRMLDDGNTLEVVRLCTDGSKDVCSFLYSRAARIAKELGYSRLVTYILESESGTSLFATGWREAAITSGGDWSRPSRPRKTTAPICKKRRFEKLLIDKENKRGNKS